MPAHAPPLSGLAAANAHVWAEVFEWLSDPRDVRAAKALRASCRRGLLGFDVAVHSGGVALAAHDRHVSHDESASCRWVGGWFPVPATASQRGGTVLLPAADVVVRLELPTLWDRGGRRRSHTSGDESLACTVILCETRRPQAALSEASSALLDGMCATDLCIQAPLCGALGSVLRPSRLVSGAAAMKLTSIDLSGATSIVEIGDAAFESWLNLASVNLSGLRNVTRIGNAFASGCLKLRSVDFTGMTAVREIGFLFLAYCSGLSMVDLSPFAATLRRVGWSFLQQASRVHTIVGLGHLALNAAGDNWLNGCESLRAVDLRAVAQVHEPITALLYSCRALRTVDCTPLARWRAVGGDHLSACMGLTAFDTAGLTGVVEIHEGFLKTCWNLRSIDTRGLTGVTAIGAKCLHACRALEDFDAAGLTSVRTIDSDFLDSCTSLTRFSSNGLGQLRSVGPWFLSRCDALAVVDTSGLTALEAVGHAFMNSSPKAPEPLAIPSPPFAGMAFRRDENTGFVAVRSSRAPASKPSP